MMSWSAEPGVATQRGSTDVEAAFRAALLESVYGLPLGERNLLALHHAHDRTLDQLAAMLSSSPAAVARQLERSRARILRELRRGLAARLDLDRRALDQLADVARPRLEHALARILGATSASR